MSLIVLSPTGEIRTQPMSLNSKVDTEPPLSAPEASQSTDASNEDVQETPRGKGARGGRRRLRCSICKQCFSRSEHLTRHERSHRGERPFSCTFCDTRFTRKDLIKNHVKRHHSELADLQENVSGRRSTKQPSSRTDEIIILGPTKNQPIVPVDDGSSNHENVVEIPEWDPSFISSQDMDMTDQRDIHDDWRMSNFLEASHSEIDIDSILAEIGSGNLSNCLQETTPNGLGFPPLSHLHLQNDSSNPQPMLSLMSPSLLQESPQSSTYTAEFTPQRTPLEVSRTKHEEIGNEMTKRNPEKATLFPSRLAFEGYLATFFDLVLPTIPCIHTPTWQANQSPPSLLMAMAALGAALSGKDETSLALHHAARLSILSHVESYNFSSKNHPAWVIQTLFLCMSFGTWSGSLALAQQALACQSILAQIVGHTENPDDSWAAHKDDLDVPWDEWITTETIIRTKLVVYVYFQNLNLASNIPPALLNSEVNISLPSSEAEWLATTEEAWSQQQKYMQTRPATFSETLEGFMSQDHQPAISCSAFGSLVMLHAILQQIWHIRQHDPTRNSPAQILSLERALEKWKALWDSNPESSLSTVSPHYWLALSGYVLLASAYSRVYTIIGRIRLSTIIHDSDIVAAIMCASVKEIPRSLGSVNAALHAMRALALPAKMGRVWTNYRESGACSLHPYSFCSMQLCIFISKWLELLSSVDTSCWTHTENQVVELAEAFVDYATPDNRLSDMKLHVKLLYAWVELFTTQRSWGITPVLTEAMRKCGKMLS